jgi:hypothetical protein
VWGTRDTKTPTRNPDAWGTRNTKIPTRKTDVWGTRSIITLHSTIMDDIVSRMMSDTS